MSQDLLTSEDDESDLDTDSIIASIQTKTEILLEYHLNKISDSEKKVQKLEKRQTMGLEEMNKHLELLDAEKFTFNELRAQYREFYTYSNTVIQAIVNAENDQTVLFWKSNFKLECKRFQNPLPIYSKKSTILTLIRQNQVTIITAETGSGKSTQIVQYIHQQYDHQQVVCTQPRKVAAISLAKRVSEEMNMQFGSTVGYRVGASNNISSKTTISFVTDHVLLNECLNDPDLRKYNFIIVDEAHERSISTDLLLAMTKKALDRRPELRLVISSATIDPKIFKDYFKERAACLHVAGRVFPVQVVHEEVSIGGNYLQEAVRKTKEVHQTQLEGDILVFLTTPNETEKAQELLINDPSLEDSIYCLILHGRLQPEEQQRVFEPTPYGKRKIVFATNSAETSITIPNIRYVIDSGMVKEKHYEKERNVSLLRVGPVNKSSAVQRQGRAGRTQEGKCFRLYTEEEFKAMADEMLPEILRENLGIALLKLYQFGVEDPLRYDFVQPPSQASLHFARRELVNLGALQNNNLTEDGQIMATLGVEPKLGKFIALAINDGLAVDAMVIAAACSIGSSMFFRAGSEDDRQAADRLKVRFCKEDGDLFTMLEVYKEWYNVKDRSKNPWCVCNSMNAKTLRYTKEMLFDMTVNLEKLLRVEIDKDFADFNLLTQRIPRLLSQCFTKNVAYFSGYTRGGYFIPDKGSERFYLHPSSALSFLSICPKWLLFTEILTTTRNYIINTTVLPDHIGEELFGYIEVPHIKAQKDWTIGKATAKALGIGTSQPLQEISMQNEISQNIYLEFDANIGKVTLYSEDGFARRAIAVLEKAISNERKNFDRRLHTAPLSEGNSTAVVLQKGGIGHEILQAGEYNAILICQGKVSFQDFGQSDMVLSKVNAQEIFQTFGPISEIIQFKKQGGFTWGKVTFQDKKNAGTAVKEFRRLHLLPENFTVKPAFSPGNNHSQKQTSTVVKARWTRRPAKGNHAFISFSDLSQMAQFQGARKRIGNNFYTFKRSKEVGSLKIEGINVYVSQEEIIRSIENQYPEVKISKCVVPRNEREIESRDILSGIERQLSLAIGRHIGQENQRQRTFVVHMKPISSIKAVDYEAEIRFKDLKDAKALVTQYVSIGSAVVRLELEKTSPVISICSTVYRALKTDMEESIRTLPNVTIKIRKEKQSESRKRWKYMSNKVNIELESKDSDSIMRARMVLSDLAYGERLKFTEAQFRYYLTPKGKEFIDTLKIHESCVIKVDRKIRSMVLYGKAHIRQRLKEKIERQNQLNQRYENMWFLDLNTQPKGFIKSLVQQYEVDLVKLYEVTNANFININFLRHQLEVYGIPESLHKAKDTLQQLANDLRNDGVSEKRDHINDCPICFDVLETTSYQLEICSHSYCKECIQAMCSHDTQNKQLPLKCAKEGCNEHISIHDILKLTKEEELVQAAIEIFIAKNNDDYKYCITPDCLNVYGTSKFSNPEPYQCSICQVLICTFCHIEYHDNVGCQVSSRSQDEDLRTWLQESGKDRGVCPKCSAPIERFDGCMHITCTSCKAHVCWRCKSRWFDNSRACYDHLAQCGGIF